MKSLEYEKCYFESTHSIQSALPHLRGLAASEGVSCRKSRGPGPLEVEAAEVAGDVDDFADEIEAGHVAGFHRL